VTVITAGCEVGYADKTMAAQAAEKARRAAARNTSACMVVINELEFERFISMPSSSHLHLISSISPRRLTASPPHRLTVPSSHHLIVLSS